MRAQILKIAGVKSDKEFYKKFPTEETFMKKHGKAFKKAQMGAYIGGEKTSNPQMMNFNEYYDQTDKQITGMSNPERQQQAYQQQTFAAQQKSQGGNGGLMGSLSKMLPILENIPQAQFGVNLSDPDSDNYISSAGRPTAKQTWNADGAIDTSVQGPGVMDTIGKFAGPTGKLIEGFQALKQEKEALQGAKQWRDVSGVSLQASRTRPEQTERRYTRPEDIQNTGEEFFPIYGVGTNVLAKDGAKLQKGGGVPFDWNAASQVGTGLARNLTGNNAGASIGEGVGNLAGMIPGVGPVASAIITPVATAIGGLLDKNPKRIKRAQDQTNRNMQGMAAGAMGQGIQQQYQAYVEDGGNIRGNNMEELQVYDGEAEQISTNPYLPDGGETVMFRGPSHAKGGMDISYGNSPVEVEGGEPAVKLQDGGQQENLVVYGNLPIPKGMLEDPDAKGKKFKNYANLLSKKEEKQNKLVDKTTENLEGFDPITTFDKIKLSSYDANLIGANMKLKDLAKRKIDAAALQNAINDTAEEQGIVAEELAKGKYKVDRKAMKGKAQSGISLPYFENLLSEKQQPYYPGEIPKAEAAVASSPEDYKSLIQKYFPEEEWDNAYNVMMAESAGDPGAENKNKDSVDKGLFQINTKWHPEVYQSGNVFDPEYNVKAAADIWKNRGWKEWTSAQKALGKNWWNSTPSSTKNTESDSTDVTPITETSDRFKQIFNPKGTNNLPAEKQKESSEMVEANKRSVLMDLYNQALPFLRPTDQESLDPNQLAGEMYSMMSNQLEPVQAQSYQPQLDVPYDISLQDIRNENQADFRGAQRMMGYNPAGQANLAGQKFLANQKVGAEEFRMNQAKKDQVYSGNRATMNDAQLKNLAIYDQQYGRQEQAKSNTKANTLAALSSMSDKYAKNKLENRELGIYENLYNYRYDAKGRAVNMNPLQQFDGQVNGLRQPSLSTPGFNGNAAPKGFKYLYDENGEVQEMRKETKKDKEKARNGSIVKALKNY